jgi:hypothetical protein
MERDERVAPKRKTHVVYIDEMMIALINRIFGEDF